MITYPKAFVSGWEDWDKVKIITDIFSSNDTNIQCYALFNSYTSSNEEVAPLIEEAKKDHVMLHVWEKSEIENYVINTEAILRYLNHAAPGRTFTEEELKAKMESIAEELLVGYPFPVENEFEQKISKVPGRLFFSSLSKWTKEVAGITINALHVVPYFNAFEVIPEIKNVINTIVAGKEF